jgi:hypothetical protein
MGNDDILHLGEVQGSSTAGGAVASPHLSASSGREESWLEAASVVGLGGRSDTKHWSSLLTQSRAIT